MAYTKLSLHFSDRSTLLIYFSIVTSGRRSVNTNTSRPEVEASSIGILRDREDALHLRRRVRDPPEPDLSPRDVGRCIDRVRNEKQVCGAVVPQTSVHAVVVVYRVRRGRVDEEGLDDLLDEQGHVHCRVLDGRCAARRGRVLEGLGTWQRKSVLLVCAIPMQNYLWHHE